MHVQDDVQPFSFAPRHEAIQALVAHTGQAARFVFGYKQAPIERRAHVVESGLFEKMHIVLRDKALIPHPPKRACRFLADQLADDLVDQPRRVGPAEAPHIAFGQQPVADTDPFQ